MKALRDVYWEHHPAERGLGGNRAHWYLEGIDAEGDQAAYDWTIAKSKGKWYISRDAWPAIPISDFMDSVEAGPFDSLRAAKVAYRLHIGLGRVPEYLG